MRGDVTWQQCSGGHCSSLCHVALSCLSAEKVDRDCVCCDKWAVLLGDHGGKTRTGGKRSLVITDLGM